MMRDLAIRAARLARAVAPPQSTMWADAAVRELDEISDDAAALSWALGSLFTATVERLKSMRTWITAGRWSVAGVTAIYAGLHILAAGKAIKRLTGAPDPFVELMIAQGNFAFAESLRAMTPFLLAYALGIAATHFGAAYYLVRWRPVHFASCLAVATLFCLLVSAPAFFSGSGGPVVFAFQLIPVLMLAGAAALFAFLSGFTRREAL